MRSLPDGQDGVPQDCFLPERGCDLRQACLFAGPWYSVAIQLHPSLSSKPSPANPAQPGQS